MNVIQSTLNFKNDKLEEPNFYLETKLSREDINGKHLWIISNAEYIKSATENVE